jgi:REP element-mobilizing transposase RayT
MNRGHDKKNIFAGTGMKNLFKAKLRDLSKELKVPILAYCIMDNHYHLVLQNISSQMSAFFKRLNGEYATLYRKETGGVGYVFQNRFASQLIQDEAYLLTAIAYVLNNPVRAGICRTFTDYPWSSNRLLDSRNDEGIADLGYLQAIFDGLGKVHDYVLAYTEKELPLINSPMGKMIGGEDFMDVFLRRADRRSGLESEERRREKDYHILSIEQVIMEFERIEGINLDQILTYTLAGKKMRARFLVLLRDKTMATYREIAQIPLFSDISLNTLSSMYLYEKRKQKR